MVLCFETSSPKMRNTGKRKISAWWSALFIAVLVVALLWKYDFQINPKSNHPLFNASTPQAIAHYGYPSETHVVTTEDGYVLEIHRIPFRHGGSQTKQRKVVLIHHALLCSSFNWVVNPPHQSLSYPLVDAGYDVWIMNIRGNIYGRKHIKYDEDSTEFWDYSFAEVGQYDVPAVIDYILKTTGQPSLFYVGHSLGSTAFFVMMSKRPEYNKKVAAMFALGPGSTLHHLQSPVKYITNIFTSISGFWSFIGWKRFLPSVDLVDALGQTFCKEGDVTQVLCEHVIYGLAGYSNEINKTMIPVYVSATPAGSSVKTITHYMQVVNAKKFQEFNYGKEENLKLYGQEHPPEYDLSLISTPVYIYYSLNDWLAHPKDIMLLSERLPNVKLLHQIKEDDFNHVDFMWGVSNRRLLYDDIIQQLKTFNK